MNKPFAAVMDEEESHIEDYVVTIMRQRGIPASLMDYMLEKVQSRIKEMKNLEYAVAFRGYDEEIEKAKKEAKKVLDGENSGDGQQEKPGEK